MKSEISKSYIIESFHGPGIIDKEKLVDTEEGP